jgi:hypothetical protein
MHLDSVHLPKATHDHDCLMQVHAHLRFMNKNLVGNKMNNRNACEQDAT